MTFADDEAHSHRLGQGLGLISVTLRMTLCEVHLLQPLSLTALPSLSYASSTALQIVQLEEPSASVSCFNGACPEAEIARAEPRSPVKEIWNEPEMGFRVQGLCPS